MSSEPTKLIELSGEQLFVEVSSQDDHARPCAASLAQRVSGTIGIVREVAAKVIDSSALIVEEQASKIKIDEIQIEFGLAFEAEGNVFITKSTAKANLTIAIKITPR